MTAIYGMPVPQVDQMPAGMIGQYLLARKARQQGRTSSPPKNAPSSNSPGIAAFCSALPEELLPAEPADIIHVMHARSALLRHGFDDICRELVRGTMAAYLRPDTTLFDRCAEAVEKSSASSLSSGRSAAVTATIAEAMGVSWVDGPGPRRPDRAVHHRTLHRP